MPWLLCLIPVHFLKKSASIFPLVLIASVCIRTSTERSEALQSGVNRPEVPEDFMKGNFGFASVLLDTLKKYNKATIMLSSSIQATLSGKVWRFGIRTFKKSRGGPVL